jgi:hypothetical protein
MGSIEIMVSDHQILLSMIINIYWSLGLYYENVVSYCITQASSEIPSCDLTYAMLQYG